ncbi:MAG: methionine ABC transporter permease [Peptoniphilus sp.]|uniref:ABC transporter permease n=1 Tax=Peptoniphilus genitalis TaxID=3036303 RepID=A0ABY4TN46_9FIRM|nr:methionine ABC transporter permease [Peptoniphilus sp. SAHP1]URN40702.1 ABC transporter permease [Peptoniphilus sp. SAHP1]
MEQLMEQYTPNLFYYLDEFVVSIKETLIMLFASGILSFIFGIILGTILVVTREGNILENKFINNILATIVNVFRSIPFVILITLLIPLTRIIMGTFIGVKGAIFPLVMGCVPFFTRQVDLALSSVDKGVVEAAQSMGLSPLEIIFRVYLRESIPDIARATTITAISLLGLTAMGGAVGGGGLGAFVIRYGHNRHFTDITYVSVILILIFVTIIQFTGNRVIKKTTH